jgi:peptidyl-prolyl cis-trans isomerase B (cyclophilin B)
LFCNIAFSIKRIICKTKKKKRMSTRKNLFLSLFVGLLAIGCSDKVANKSTVSEEKPEETKQKNTMIVISTDLGEMKAILYNETPQHKENFIKLIKEGYFDGTLFHRVIDGFMIQGGDPDSKTAKPGQMLGQSGPGYTVPAEFRQELIHKKGALAAARMGDQMNPQKASSGSQFYIAQGKKYTANELNILSSRMGKAFNQTQIDTYTTVGGVPFLDYEYTVFGEVIEGLEVIDKIAKVQKDRYDRPTQDIKMTIKIIEE